ncbi:MAG TPA: DUF72 domain-containing protein [Afifellaceae bacterium]|nr:DUF72 domain-containing protein [Afifellaceae bacterium]
MARKGDIRIGISGWTYGGWRGVFYPTGLPQRRELAHAAAIFSSIEINGTFYSLQRPEYFAHWAAETPDDFVFAVKGSRFITHMLKLRNCEQPLANFLASGVLRLGPKLGPILWQFPARFHFDRDRIESFRELLPRDSEAAARLAQRHDQRVSGRNWLETDARRPLRHALEVRHESFADPEFIELLRAHDAALVASDAVDWPLFAEATADFVYCRLHGAEELYASGYDDEALDCWAARVETWAAGGEPQDIKRIAGRAAPRRARDVFVYFDNDAKVRAPFDAQGLMARVRPQEAGLADPPPSAPVETR